MCSSTSFPIFILYIDLPQFALKNWQLFQGHIVLYGFKLSAHKLLSHAVRFNCPVMQFFKLCDLLFYLAFNLFFSCDLSGDWTYKAIACISSSVKYITFVIFINSAGSIDNRALKEQTSNECCYFNLALRIWTKYVWFTHANVVRIRHWSLLVQMWSICLLSNLLILCWIYFYYCLATDVGNN